MAAFATLLFRLGFAVFAIMASVATASALMSSPVGTATRLTNDTGSIWTSQPMRIDRDNQPYERIRVPADPYPFKFFAGKGVTVLDNATFSLNNETYVLAGMERLDPKGLCRDDRSRILACGAAGRASLRGALQAGFIECFRSPVARNVYIVRCQKGGQDIAKRLRAVDATGLLASTR